MPLIDEDGTPAIPEATGQGGHLDRDPDVFDILVIGAGPCGLAAAARLREDAPSAIFTDEEHRRFHWLRKHGNRVALKQTRTGRVVSSHGEAKKVDCKMAVLDASDDKWLGRWRRLFSTFGIGHLRSPMLWHVDPRDRDSLLSYGHHQGREGELVEIRGCVGKELSKHQRKKRQFSGGKRDASIDINQRDQWDYYTPSQSLFCDHCECVARHYDLLGDLVHKEEVTGIQYGPLEDISANNSLFTVTTNKTIRHARTVILAVGPANGPILPNIPSLSFPGQKLSPANVTTPTSMPQACHSMQIASFPDPVVQSRISQPGRQTNVIVVGGGLTSFQLSDLAIRRGVTKVWHMMRGPLRVKAFDVNLHWMGKYKTLHQAYFHQADTDEERLSIIREARGGGSVTPAFLKQVKPHIKCGHLQLFERTIVTGATFEVREDGGGDWKVQTDPPIPDLPPIDYIYFATGIQSDFTTLPYLKSMLQDHPINSFGGFPCLNEDLMWKDDVPLFVTGRLAALQLGPAAPNIGGARTGAERIALAVHQVLESQSEAGRPTAKISSLDKENTVQGKRRDSGVELFNYASGTGSKFDSLEEVSY
ncbi:hypothetical protein VMCG_00847 [Cytospora schulzeri]|uniref:Uncharacterized protein n=1 Tax=Cytospora schulzeri TaxID=448051 RepID=A0A423X8W4_9PEZI|nr:hypothetical protein VMCG_00847 [Valsa malicola]